MGNASHGRLKGLSTRSALFVARFNDPGICHGTFHNSTLLVTTSIIGIREIVGQPPFTGKCSELPPVLTRSGSKCVDGI